MKIIFEKTLQNASGKMEIHGENFKILKMRSNKSEKLQSLLWRYGFGWDLNLRSMDPLAFTESTLIPLEIRRAIKKLSVVEQYIFSTNLKTSQFP